MTKPRPPGTNGRGCKLCQGLDEAPSEQSLASRTGSGRCPTDMTTRSRRRATTRRPPSAPARFTETTRTSEQQETSTTMASTRENVSCFRVSPRTLSSATMFSSQCCSPTAVAVLRCLLRSAAVPLLRLVVVLPCGNRSARLAESYGLCVFHCRSSVVAICAIFLSTCFLLLLYCCAMINHRNVLH